MGMKFGYNVRVASLDLESPREPWEVFEGSVTLVLGGPMGRTGKYREVVVMEKVFRGRAGPWLGRVMRGPKALEKGYVRIVTPAARKCGWPCPV